MPLQLPNAPSMIIRRAAFERAGLTRTQIDERFGLTPDEFRVEGEAIVIGPVYADDAIGELIALLEERGLVYFDEMFDLSGNWPEWLRLYVMAEREGASGAT